MKFILIVIIALTLPTIVACQQQPSAPPAPTSPTPIDADAPSPTPSLGRCEMQEEVLQLANQTVTLPATGIFVLESHLLTKEDGQGWPATVADRIEGHLSRACAALKAGRCEAIYTTRYHREWTPAEGGRIGQGSVGELRPTVLEEMWSGNMMWSAKTKPKPGTRFLAQVGKKAVVVVVGFETGPGDRKWLGGLQGEVMWWLGAKNTTPIRWGRLKDQSLSPGPIDCEK